MDERDLLTALRVTRDLVRVTRDLVRRKVEPELRERPKSIPEYVNCVLLGTWRVPPPDTYEVMSEKEKRQVRDERMDKTTWCGRDVGADHEWLFVDASHAALNAAQEGRLLACEDCALAIASVLLGQGVLSR